MTARRPEIELHWTGKQDRPVHAPGRLVELPVHSYPADDSRTIRDDNRVLFGENLHALRALEPEFAGSLRCICIDPPYNTGSGFAHYDDDVEHARWLSLMRDRIEVMHRLLAPNGSLWILIDDTEAHYLKVVCDEIFGRAGFIGTVIWQKKYTQANDATFLSDAHDYLLVYARDRAQLRFNGLPRSARQQAAYRNPDEDPRGPWKATPLHAKSGSDAAFEYRFRNGVAWRPPAGTFPRFSAANLKRMEENEEIWFGRNGRAVPARKTFLRDVTPTVVANTLWLFEEVGHNHEAKTEAKQLNPADPFSTPKPERLLHRILQIATDPGDTVLDAFAGSGTTGAVAHKMGRRYLLIESGAHCHTHLLPRLRRVIDGADPGGITATVGWQGGGSYRYFRVEAPPI